MSNTVAESRRESSLSRWSATLAEWIAEDPNGQCDERRDVARTARCYIMPPAGPGGLGDQAFVEAAFALAANNACTSVLVTDDYDSRWGGSLLKVPTIRLPLHCSGRALTQFREFIGGLSAGDALIGIGADGLYGSYGKDGLSRLMLLGEAARHGVAATLVSLGIGTTWDDQYAEMFRALPSSLRVCARDQISLQRASQLGLPRVPWILTADLAIAWEGQATSVSSDVWQWNRRMVGEGRPVVALNLHGLLRRAGSVGLQEDDQVVETGRRIVHWISSTLRAGVLLIPHDRRPQAREVEILKRLMASLPGADQRNAMLSRVPKTVGESRDLVGLADLVVAGRMHLAISAVCVGVPVVCLDYENKCHGVMKPFGMDKHVVSWGVENMLAVLERKVEALFDRRQSAAQEIVAALPLQRLKARQNLDRAWLGDSEHCEKGLTE